jgi:hypothetical protein
MWTELAAIGVREAAVAMPGDTDSVISQFERDAIEAQIPGRYDRRRIHQSRRIAAMNQFAILFGDRFVVSAR